MKCSNETSTAKKRIVVVGAGPSGLTAARELASRDFDVVLLEKGDKPGGQLNLAKIPPRKEKIGWIIDNLTNSATKQGVSIKYNTTATKQIIDSYKPYAVVLATGGEALTPKIPGSDSDDVVTVTPLLTGEKAYTGIDIAIVGSGMTGLESAEFLMEQGNRITIIEMADSLAPGAYSINAQDVISRLEKGGTRFLVGRKLESIGKGVLFLSQKNGMQETIQTDLTVLAIGVRSNNALEKELAGHYERLFSIGDASKPGRISNATQSAFELARKLK